jgi:decaprenyl-phosphate phosphoribosyltransferase
MRGHLSLLRTDHWVKNAFLLPGTLLAVLVLEEPLVPVLLPFLVAFLSTCLIASANYVINEWLDAQHDRFHPAKKDRLAARGVAAAPVVYGLYAASGAGGLALASLLSWQFLLTGLLLLFMGLLYNVRPFRSKDRVFLDVISESANNPIRFLLGWFVVTTDFLPPSSLLLGFWMAGAYLMSMKRLSEFRFIADRKLAALYRGSFAKYTEETLLLSSFAYAMSAALFIGVFLVKHRVEQILSFPFIVALFTWYLHISLKPHSAAQHPEKLYREWRFLVFTAGVVCLVALLFVTEIPRPTAAKWARLLPLRQARDAERSPLVALTPPLGRREPSPPVLRIGLLLPTHADR